MGGCFSEETKQEVEEALTKPKYSWEREERVDRSLLLVSQQEGAVIVRLPGQLNGRQFIIQQCTQCTILVLDHTETVTIDRCTDCQILVAPCRTSVFLRDCSNCRCVVACQQLRTRDCKKCSLSLLSTTPPVIEASSEMTFSCLQCSYPELKGLFDSAKLSVFNNSWSTVHDFDGGTSAGNWSVISDPLIIDLPTEGEATNVGISFNTQDSVVPLTVGPKQRPPDDICLVAFFDTEDSDAHAISFVSSVRSGVTLVHTRRAKLQSHEASRVFPDNEMLASKASNGHVIFLEVAGIDCCKLCAQATQTLGDGVYVSPTVVQGKADVDAFNRYLELSIGM